MAEKFKESESQSFSINSANKRKYFMYEYEGVLSKDNFRILDINKQIEIKDFQFMLVSSLWDSYQEYLGGMIGLKFQRVEIYDTPEKTDLIYQLKEKKLINSSVFSLVYEDDYNGKLYIGNYFHEFNAIYSENDFISTKAGSSSFINNDWQINIDQILSGNTIFQNTKTYLNIFYEYGVIAATEQYQAEINSSFFNDYYANNICEFTEKHDKASLAFFRKYKYIVCNKKAFDKSVFPQLSFYNAEMNFSFTLSHEDLFYEYKDKIYFLVVFPIYAINVYYWNVGKPFIKKYRLFLDEDKKTIGLYFNDTYSQKAQIQEKENENEYEKEQEEQNVHEQEQEIVKEQENVKEKEKEIEQEPEG